VFVKKKFVLAGMGYVAPRHLRAIRDNGGELIAVCDTVHDVVGILDSFYPDCLFFRDEDKFKEFCKENKPDYLCIASPNNTHFQYAKFGLANNCTVISEKPLCVYPSDLDILSEYEKRYDKKVYSILQLRLHQEVKRLKEMIDASDYNEHQIVLRYCTPRGPWYKKSWKIREDCGGVLLNIAIHLFDLLIFTFGNYTNFKVNSLTETKANGTLNLEKGQVEWFVSIDRNDVLDGIPKRSLEIGGKFLNLDAGFTDLHTDIYRNILLGNGYNINDCRPAIELIHNMKESYNTPKGER